MNGSFFFVQFSVQFCLRFGSQICEQRSSLNFFIIPAWLNTIVISIASSKYVMHLPKISLTWTQKIWLQLTRKTYSNKTSDSIIFLTRCAKQTYSSVRKIFEPLTSLFYYSKGNVLNGTLFSKKNPLLCSVKISSALLYFIYNRESHITPTETLCQATNKMYQGKFIRSWIFQSTTGVGYPFRSYVIILSSKKFPIFI